MYCLVLLYEILVTYNLIWSYMVVYGLSLFVVFFTFLQLPLAQMKTTFSFNDLSAGGTYVKMIIIAFFSMAGVPPFVGFFSKLFLFILLASAHFALGFPFFFTILFVGLYFYIQNIRFLNASNVSNFQPIFELHVRTTPVFFSLGYVICYLLTFGAFYVDDILLISKWTIL